MLVMKRRTLLSAAGAVLMAGAMPRPGFSQAPASDWAKIKEAAKKEGKVVFYGAQPSTDRLGKAFQKANPDIEIEYQRGVTGVLITKVEQERATNADGADVMISTEPVWFAEKARQDLLLIPAGPAFAAWPAQYVREKTVIVPGTEPFVIPYNTKLVANPPKGYADLFRPEFAGACGMAELSATNLIAFYDWLEKTQGADYLTRYRALNPKLYVSSVGEGQAVASGEIAISVHGIPSATRPLMDQGAPIAYTVPNPSFGYVYAMGGFKWSKRPNAARVFMDYVMSAEGQTVWHGQGESASPLPGIKGALNIDTINPYDPPAYPPERIKSISEHWTKIFK